MSTSKDVHDSDVGAIWASARRSLAVLATCTLMAGVVTFYEFFRTEPRGKYMIRICLGTACYVKNAERLVDRFKEELGIEFGETSTDKLFTLEGSRCLGTCGLAPVVMVEDNVHGKLIPDQVPALLDDYIHKVQKS